MLLVSEFISLFIKETFASLHSIKKQPRSLKLAFAKTAPLCVRIINKMGIVFSVVL